MPARRKAPTLTRPCLVLGLLLATFAALLVGSRSFRPSGIPLWVVQAIDEQVARDPASPTFRATRAWMLFEQGEPDEAIVELREAIRCNPGDLGQTYQPSSGRELSAEALRHGEAQLRQMLADRPQMNKHIEPGDELWTWAVRKFAGEDTDRLVYWDSGNPSPFEADSTPGNDGRAHIRIRPVEADEYWTETYAFDHLWACAVFELHNVIPRQDWGRTHDEVRSGALEREEYISTVLSIEESAAQRARAFYIQQYFPWMREKGLIETDPADWQCYKFYANDTERKNYWRTLEHWEYFSDWYDLLQIENQFARGEYKEIENTLAALETRADKYNNLPAALHYWRGHLLLANNEPEQALAEFNKSLEVESSEVSEVVFGKAMALEYLGRPAEAIESLTQLLEQLPGDSGAIGETLLRRGMLSSRQGDVDGGLNDFNLAIQLDPPCPEAFGQRGILHYEMCRFDLAVMDLTENLRLDPESDYAYKARGKALGAQNRLDEAMADFDAAIRLAPTDAESYAYRGWGYLLTDRYELAAADFEHALSLQPNTVNALAGRARLSIAQKDKVPPDWTRVCEDAQRSCKLTDWRQADYIDLLAAACRESGDAEAAEKWAQKAREVLASQETKSAEQSEPPTTSAEDSTPAIEDSSNTKPRAVLMPAIAC